MSRFLHTMLRVGDLQRSVDFYTKGFGMNEIRRNDVPDGKYTLAFVGYGNEESSTVIELTYNYGVKEYDLGTRLRASGCRCAGRRRDHRETPGLWGEGDAGTRSGEVWQDDHRVRRRPGWLQDRTRAAGLIRFWPGLPGRDLREGWNKKIRTPEPLS